MSEPKRLPLPVLAAASSAQFIPDTFFVWDGGDTENPPVEATLLGTDPAAGADVVTLLGAD